MLKIYKALRDSDYMAGFGESGLPWWEAGWLTVVFMRDLRQACVRGVHTKMDVWGYKCWHEYLQAKIDRLQKREDLRVWGNPNIDWDTDDLPVLKDPPSVGHDEVDYHYWRHP